MSNPENDALLNLQPVIVARPNASQGYIDQTADAADQAARQALDMLSDTADTRDNGAVLPPLVIVDQGIPQEGCLSSEKLHQLSEEAQRSTPPHEKTTPLIIAPASLCVLKDTYAGVAVSRDGGKFMAINHSTTMKPDVAPKVIAHEIGHVLGLRHAGVWGQKRASHNRNWRIAILSILQSSLLLQ